MDPEIEKRLAVLEEKVETIVNDVLADFGARLDRLEDSRDHPSAPNIGS